MTELRRGKLAVLFSGGGRTLENLARKVVEGSLPVDIVVAVSSHRGAAGVEKAKQADVSLEVVDYREHRGDFSQRLAAILAASGADWVALAGFLRHFDVPSGLRDRVLNIHPALLPKFGGKGFYGDRVHQAVLEAGERFSGCTVHFVTDEYDRGPAILQRVVPVQNGDTVDTLAARVFEQECLAYPEAIRLCVDGRVRFVDGKAVFA